MALDGLKIAVDEAHHALCVEDMTLQLTNITSIPPIREGEPRFLRQLALLTDNLPNRLKLLGCMGFACVSETLITSILTKVPADERVLQAIRDVVLDHARDEARHHVYFSDVMFRMWEQLPPEDRDIIGPLFAEWVKAFLHPDHVAELGWLEACGFSKHEAAAIVNETYEAYDQSKAYRDAAKPTISLMKKFGILDHARTNDAFAAAGLIQHIASSEV
jgi:hypothetical protein